MDAKTQLCTGLEQLGLALCDSQIDQIMNYMSLIKTWNKAYNLVGTSDTRQLIQKHILDSLAITPHIFEGPVLDVGSGAGLPGIPLAIALPDISFTLLDSNGKKARFMRQVGLELKLRNLNIVQSRVEQYKQMPMANTVLSRAFAPLEKAVKLLSEVCAPKGCIQIMLGSHPENLPKFERIGHVEIVPISVPGLDSNRNLLVAKRIDAHD
jgi:16S rRNA (guanine527-N7)-methyltransferase